MTSIKSGSCLCKAIQYQLTAPPDQMFVCHCNNCQKSSGSVFMANCIFQKDQLQIIQGHDSLRTYHDSSTRSGSTLERSFCAICGSSLFVCQHTGEPVQHLAVTSGTIDQREDLHPTIEVWERDRRPWLSPVEGIPKMQTQ
ncbi:DUF636 domain protein [Aspergillus steynii IBT 23096]|uniref:DUF636 domain protein n=1 Tax=Aspergillus steynii IBT 23096 TaxID=1392250 RepID=A0A2I2G0X5_9EURO|nr:DUF636 domain protein [Aspergillus steynii IBT 23096]PLB46544.1 DUF636 domain protein [Aspergillus steynii IBT 23096]